MTITNHGSPVPPASAPAATAEPDTFQMAGDVLAGKRRIEDVLAELRPAATAEVIPASPDTTWFANYPLCAGGNVARFTRPVPPTKHCGDPSCPCMSARPADPTGEEAETITPGERHQAMFSAGIDATSPNQRTRELSALVVKYEALVTAQATELAALRARVEEYEHALAGLGVTRGSVNGVQKWWHINADQSEDIHDTLEEAVEAQWQVSRAALAPHQTTET